MLRRICPADAILTATVFRNWIGGRMRRRAEVAPPSATALIVWEPKLQLWTRAAAQSFALYRGANMALSEPPYDTTEARDLAHRSLREAALMTVVRLSALFDTDPTTISFQGVNRALKSGDIREDLARIYSADSPTHLANKAAKECFMFQNQFIQSYSSVNWEAYARLQHFRNREIAHLTPEETTKYIKYGELDEFAYLAFSLQNSTSLLTAGFNTDLRQEADDDAECYKAVWLKAFGTE